MPNWVSTNWNVTLPTEKVKRFLNYFLDWNESDNNKLKGRLLYRTFIERESVHITETVPGFSALSFVSDSAWSLESILVEGDKDADGICRCPGLDWVCQDCEVETLEAIGDEPNMGFRQYLSYTKEIGYVNIEAEDVTMWMCEHCHTCGYWEDQAPDIDRTICPECGEKFEEEDND